MNSLTHFDAQGQAHMVDVSKKSPTHRVAVAQGRIRMDDLAALLDQAPGLPLGKSPNCAPADGLYLQEVLYPSTNH